METLRIVVAGAAGRMGKALLRAVIASEDLLLSGAIEASGKTYLGKDVGTLTGDEPAGIRVTDDISAALADADVVIDFTQAQASVALAVLCAKQGKALVIGTTGFSENEEAQIGAAAEQTAIVKSGNMSLGVNVLVAMVRQAAKALPDFDIEILEMHHRMKTDAPSGTALLLGEAAAAARGVSLKATAVKARAGSKGVRRSGEIGFASLRGGTVIGEHDVILAGAGERLTLRHDAEDRAIFVNGALAAARWVAGKPPGLYTMADVLGLSEA